VLVLFMFGLVKAMKQDAKEEEDRLEQMQAELLALGGREFIRR